MATETLTDNQRAFLEYVDEMRNTIGRRFVQNLIRDHGFDAFDDFWQKFCTTLTSEEREMPLTAEESQSLVKAVYADDRREFLRRGGGALLAVLGFGVAKDGFDDLRHSRPPTPFNEAMTQVIKMSGGTISLILGGALILLDPKPANVSIATVASGPEGEKNVQKLVKDLDALFEPMVLAMRETNPHVRD